jgi:hypothetical protein
VTVGHEPLAQHGLQKQYEIVLQEYRFQVQLNWDRAKHFLIFNTAILAAAVALYKNGATMEAKLGVAALMFLAAANSLVGRRAVGQGHEIYREIRSLKTELEKRLGLGPLAIRSTLGMKREHDEAAEGTPATGKPRLWSINSQLRALLLLIGAFSTVGASYAAFEAATAPTSSDSAPRAAASAR